MEFLYGSIATCSWCLFINLIVICFQKCVKRVEKDDTGQKHCTGQYFDYWSCIDKCVSTSVQVTDSYFLN